MGREALCPCQIGAGSGQVKALLEAQELVPRGSFKSSCTLANLEQLRLEDEWLRFQATVSTNAESVGLQLALRS